MEKIKYLKNVEIFYKKEIWKVLFIDKDISDLNTLFSEILNIKYKKIYINFKYKWVYIWLTLINNELIKIEVEDNVFLVKDWFVKRITIVDNDIPDRYVVKLFKKIYFTYLKVKWKI